jgi:type II secretory pathway pseudopilin PulG
VVLLVTIVCIAMASLVLLSVLRLSVARQRGAEAEAWRVQAGWLAESALERAAARLAADPDYQGETWDLPTDRLGASHAAVVRIEVEEVPGQERRRAIRVRADYPKHPQHRAHRTKRITIDLEPAS